MSEDAGRVVRQLVDMALEVAKLESRMRDVRDSEPMLWEHRRWLHGCAAELTKTRRTLLKVVFEREPELAETDLQHVRFTRGLIADRHKGSDAKREHAEWRASREGKPEDGR